MQRFNTDHIRDALAQQEQEGNDAQKITPLESIQRRLNLPPNYQFMNGKFPKVQIDTTKQAVVDRYSFYFCGKEIHHQVILMRKKKS